MDTHDQTRRTVIATGAAITFGGVAGCLEGGDGDPDEGDSEDITRPDDWPDNPAFTPNPNVDGPGGEVDFAMEFSLREGYRAADEYETFEVEFDSVVLHTDDGDEVTVPVERTIDFYDFELGTEIVLIFDAAIPAATYTHADFEMSASEIVHVDNGDVTENFSKPERAEFSGGGREMAAGEQWLATATRLWVQNPPTLEVGSGIGTYSGPGDMTDPGYFSE